MPSRAISRLTPRTRGRASAGSVLGFTFQLPEGIEDVTALDAPPEAPSFRGRERRAGGERIIGELDVSTFAPSLIVDRDGVLVEAVNQVAAATLSSPRDGHATTPYELVLPCGPAWRVDVVVRRDAAGVRPNLPYLSALAIGHPDYRRAAALFVMIRTAEDGWRGASAVLDSLRFADAAAAPVRPARAALPLTF